MHGRSLLPILTGWHDAPGGERTSSTSTTVTGRALRAQEPRCAYGDRWKLIHFYEQPEEWELYDLKSDPDEKTQPCRG